MKNLNLETPFPAVDNRLIKALEQQFPSKDFGTDVSLRDIDYHHGQRSVVNFLKHQLEIQSENILTSEN